MQGVKPCPRCGHLLPDDVHFCSKCGYDLRPSPLYNPPAPVQPTVQIPVPPSNVQAPPVGKCCIGCVGVFLLLMLIGSLVPNHSRDNTVPAYMVPPLQIGASEEVIREMLGKPGFTSMDVERMGVIPDYHPPAGVEIWVYSVREGGALYLAFDYDRLDAVVMKDEQEKITYVRSSVYNP